MEAHRGMMLTIMLSVDACDMFRGQERPWLREMTTAVLKIPQLGEASSLVSFALQAALMSGGVDFDLKMAHSVWSLVLKLSFYCRMATLRRRLVRRQCIRMRLCYQMKT